MMPSGYGPTGLACFNCEPHDRCWKVGASQCVRPLEQPAPKPNDHPAVWDLVMEDMRKRDAVGAARYGTRLQPHNGRDALRDAYEEALDLTVYLRQEMYERTAQSSKLLAMDYPWPVPDIIGRLSIAATHLLLDHDCDHHGHEEFHAAAKAAEEWLACSSPLQGPRVTIVTTPAPPVVDVCDVEFLKSCLRYMKRNFASCPEIQEGVDSLLKKLESKG